MELPTAAFLDHMHNLRASGGIAQYELNQLVLAIERHCAVTPADIDSWTSQVKLAVRANAKLANNFVSTRIVRKQSSHIRAFASEVLVAVTVLGFFFDALIEPLAVGMMANRLACFRFFASFFERGRMRIHSMWTICDRRSWETMSLTRTCTRPV